MPFDPESPLADDAFIDDADLPRVNEFRNRHRTAMLVTFFTDMVGSTELAEQRGEVHAQNVRRLHDRMLLEIIERDGSGECLKTIGDALMCIFAEPSAAVARAVEIQEALTEYNLEHEKDSPIRVRIGMHVGQVAIEGRVRKDVFGRHVNRSARVESLAHPGQILMTHSVSDNASGWLAEKGFKWCDHGEYKLKDIPEPVRIVEVCAPGQLETRTPRGIRYRRRNWLAWTVAALALVSVIVLLAFADFSGEPLTVKLRVEVVRDGNRGLTVTHVQPFQPDDTFAYTGELSRPGHAAIFWIGATGNVTLVADSSRQKTATVNYPDVGNAVPIKGLAGAEVIVLVASDDSFNAAEISEQLAALGPPPAFELGSPPHAVRFDAESVYLDPEYRDPGTPISIARHTPTSHAELIRSLLRLRTGSFAGIILRHD